MVSAAKLKRAQDAITQMRPYSEKLQEILGNLSATLDISENEYSATREVKNVLIIAVTSNRGLCGGFNNNIIKHVNVLINGEYKNANPKVLCLGKKVKDSFKRSDFYYTNDDLAKLKISSTICHLKPIYNQFVNAASQNVLTEQFLPIVANVQEEGKSAGDYIFEPSKEEIVEDLIPKTLKIQLFKALLDSQASEHGARMTAMHKATDNASDLQKALKLEYNKARQAAITNEILEIVGGAEALNN